MKLLKYALMVLFSVGMMSCGGGGSDDPVDEQKPTVTITSPNSPVNTGDIINVAFTAKDNIELKSYRVQIRKPVGATGMTKSYNGNWSFDTFQDKADANGDAFQSIEGKTGPVEVKFPVATDLGDNTHVGKGVYEIIVTVDDAAEKTNSVTVKKEFTLQ
ncbi:hypothetical protein [Marinifilum fragile]|uniref:hypothetical protein n=1 Tax=Marinifilum fragile TaxID=570161 RepID=UPI002AA705E6|nr:hypothetical protein [Marinifilum fragile]